MPRWRRGRSLRGMADHLHPEVLRGSSEGRGAQRPRLEALAGAWLAGYGRASTRRAYRQDLKAWLAFCADHGLAPLTARRSDVELFARSEESDGLAAATVARRITALASWYAWLVDEGYVPSNPVARVR